MAPHPAQSSPSGPPPRGLEAQLDAGERQELACLGYFLEQWASLHARGLIADELHRDVGLEYRARRERLERKGRYLAAVQTARALAGRRPEDALAWAVSAREIDPDRVEAWALSLEILERLGRLDEAIALAAEAAARFPELAARLRGLREHRDRVEAGRTGAGLPAISRPAPAQVDDVPPRAKPAPAPWGWETSLAARLLEDHWQKLLLGMAVLLIVVSSTVGAQVLLGPRLWSPVGKCALALAYTLLFAGLGGALGRWGAARASRIVLQTALAVVPIHFVLLGEMRLVADPSASRLLVLGLDAAVLLALARRLTNDLRIGHGRGLAAALGAIGLCTAATARGVAHGWALGALWSASAVYLGAVGRLNATAVDPDAEREAESRRFGLGLLSFAMLVATVRAGSFVPHVWPAILGVPAMTAAIAAAATGRGLARLGADARPAVALRFVGVVLSGLAFALALSRPPAPSALLSGNTLATALLGLVLYGTSLRIERRPAYLYFGFGALVASYFGAFYFLVDLIRTVEDAARSALGYPGRLPEPFKAINGLVFSVVLGALAVGFRRGWGDERLARHCHYLGVPFSIAACLFSLGEAKAAVICLSGYAVLYPVAAAVFAQPLVLPLGCAAMAGAALIGVGLVPGSTTATLVLVAVGLGWLWRAGAAALRARGVEPAYGRTLVAAATAATLAAMAVATRGALAHPEAWATFALTFALAAGLWGWMVDDPAARTVADLAVAAALGSWLCAADGLTGHGLGALATLALALAAFAAALPALAFPLSSRAGGARSLAFAAVLPELAVWLVLAAAGCALASLRASPASAGAALLGGIALLATTRWSRSESVFRAGLGLIAASALVLTGWARADAPAAIALGSLALVSAGCAAALIGVADLGRRLRMGAPSAGSALAVSAPLALAAAVLAALGAAAGSDAAALCVLALLLAGAALARLTAAWRRAWTTSAAGLATIAAVYVTLFSVARPTPAAGFVLGLAAAMLALVFWAVGDTFRRTGSWVWTGAVSRPLDRLAIGLTGFALLPAPDSPVLLFLVGVLCLLMIRSFPSPGWLYPAIGAFAASLYFGALAGCTGPWLMAWCMAGAFGLSGLGAWVRRSEHEAEGRFQTVPPGYDLPLFAASVLAALLAIGVRLDLGQQHGVPWTDYAGLPIALGLLGALFYAVWRSPGWMYAAMGLISLGLCQSLVSPGESAVLWLLRGFLLTLLWQFLGAALGAERSRGGRPLSAVVQGALRAIDEGTMAPLAVSSAATLGAIVSATLAVVGGWPSPVAIAGPADWLAVAAAPWLGALAVRNLKLAAWPPPRREGVLVAVVATAWWLGTPWSPLRGQPGLDPGGYLAAVTSLLAVGNVALGLGRRGVLARLDPQGLATDDVGLPYARVMRFAWRLGAVLAAIGPALTLGRNEPSTTAALLLAAGAFGGLAIGRGSVPAAYAAAVAWWAACLAGARLAASAFGDSGGPLLVDVGLGGLVAIAGLWIASMQARRRGAESGGDESTSGRPSRSVAVALERLILPAAVVAALMALAPSIDPSLGAPRPLASLGILVGVAATLAGLGLRWNAEWPVYLAQAALGGGYVASRPLLHAGEATDALVWMLLGYLDLGLAEALGRSRRTLLARPTLHAALVLPLIPLARSLWHDPSDVQTELLLLASAAFYGAAGFRVRGAGYLGLGLADAFLWVVCARHGCSPADEPHLFVIPVALSAILFAETERRSLGREWTQAVRMGSMIAMYVALAVPMVRFDSFGVWLAVLTVSFAGVVAGIGLRVQSFLWLGLAGFVLDVGYQVGRLSLEHALARWAIMLALGLGLIAFVALNETKRIVVTLRGYLEEVRSWD